MKRMVHVSVFGPTNSGVTTITDVIKKAVEKIGIETKVAWDEYDGPPKNSITDFKIRAILDKTVVVLTESRQRKIERDRHESPNDYLIRVDRTENGKYRIIMSVLGIDLVHEFTGKEDYVKEKARAIAARLANELDADIIDSIPREYDYNQPR